MTSGNCIWKNTWTWIISIIWIEKLRSHHHLLLLIILASSRSFSLINKIKQMSLICINTILISNSTCCSYSIISNPTCSSWWAHCTWSFDSISAYNRNNIILILCLHSVENSVTCITWSKLRHKVSIEHCLSHLNLILILIYLILILICLSISKPSNSCLIKHVVFLILWNLLIDDWSWNPI